MKVERLDCDWCGSARSIEHGICQVCLMEYPLDTQVIEIPFDRRAERRADRKRLDRPSVAPRVVDLTDSEIGIAE